MMGRSFASRLKVVGPTFGAGSLLWALVASCGASKMGWGSVAVFEVWASVLAGPFAG
jgi:hypothetical protein